MSEESITVIKKEREKLKDKLVENLPVLRAKLDISQGELAELLGVTRQTITGIETKKVKPTWPMVLSILLIFESNPITSILLGPLGILTVSALKALGLKKIFGSMIKTNKE